MSRRKSDRASRQTAAASLGSDGIPAAAASAASASRLISSFSSVPGLKYGTFFGGTSTLSPVFGLRPLRGSRLRRRKLPNPRSSIFSPRCSASMMLLKTVSTMTSECFLVRSETRETSSTSSAFVMLPAPLPMLTLLAPRPIPYNLPATASAVAKVIPERCGPGAFALAILLVVGAELVALERANAQADLPLLRAQLDDLHLVGVAHLQIDLLARALGATALSDSVRIVELRDVNEPFDPLVELDEGAEVRHPRHLALDQ